MGMGFVGVTTALVFADSGWNVTGLDPDQAKINSLLKGNLPFYEPGVEQLLSKHVANGTIAFTTSPESAIRENQIIFLCVGTPSSPDGSADLRYIKQAASWIGEFMQEHKWIVIKSTVPIGTHEKVRQWVTNSQVIPTTFDTINNPEFLREGSALEDTMKPDRIVIGTTNEDAANHIAPLYANMKCPVIITKPRTAEMIKYASNSFLATKISFMNELARLTNEMDINISDVSKGMGLDPRIGNQFLRAGIGYGGSCFPKDVDSLIHTAKEKGLKLSLLEKVVKVNKSQATYFLEKLEQQLSGFKGKTIAILGIAFKPDTDDIREAPSLKIISSLLKKKAIVQVHDPVVALPTEKLSDRLIQCKSVEDTLYQADAMVICTEWEMYRNADWVHLKDIMRNQNILDGRNILDGKKLISLGFNYLSVSNL